MQLHEKIIIARQKKGFTQEDLADLSNVTVRTIQRLESGRNIPRAYTVKAIAAALGITFEELTDLETRSKPSESIDVGNEKEESTHLLQIICLSCFSYLVIPFVHFLIPYYILKKSKIQDSKTVITARSIIKNQIYWVVALNFLMLLSFIWNFIGVIYFEELFVINYLLPFLIMYILNFGIITITLLHIKKKVSIEKILLKIYLQS